MIKEYLNHIQEKTYDYMKDHGHERAKVNSVIWYFHNYEHGYKHCKGGMKNPYEIEHYKNIHIINKQYARGHGQGRKPQWFKFTKKVKSGWELESGIKISLNQVPSELK